MAEEEVLTAVSLDQEKAAVTIDTQDYLFLGQDVTLFIGIYSTESDTSSNQDLFFTIVFKTSSLEFDLTDFKVQPLTCSIEDAYWKMDIPPVKHEEILKVDYKLVNAQPDLFSFSSESGTVLIDKSKKGDYLKGLLCPDID